MFIWILAVLLIALGFLGCFINKVPGPLLAFIGVLITVFFGDVNANVWMLVLVGVLVIASMIVSKKLLPKLGEKVHPFGKGGSWGTTVGSIIGLLILAGSSNASAVGMIICFVLAFFGLPYIFAFVFEFISNKNASVALKAAGGALVTFLASTVLKLVVCYLSFDLIFGA